MHRYALAGLFSFLIWMPHTFALEIPTGIDTEAEFAEVIQMLGISTSAKLLTNPFPLGGYSGFEIGLGLEVVNIADLSKIGDQTADQDELRYSTLTIGKGLYNNIDFFFHFIPYSHNSDISEYGAIFKWSFYQAKFMPITSALIINGSSFNANDEFVSETLSIDLMTGINVDSFALYFGAGQVESWAKLIRQDTPTPKTVLNQSEKETHTFVGISLHYANIFIAGQIDRYEQPTYSGKLGLRF